MKIVCFGDSLTYGYGVGISECWVEIFKKHSKIETINKGVNGDTSSGLLSRSYKDVIAQKPSHVFLMIGTNDFLCGYSIDRVKENVIELVKEFKKYNINIIICIQPPIIEIMAKKYWSQDVNYNSVNQNISEYKEWITKYVVNNFNIKYIDFHTAICTEIKNNLCENYYVDGIHLSNIGHKIIARQVINMFISD